MKRKNLAAAVALSFLVTACATASGGVQNIAAIKDPSEKEAAYAALQAKAPKPIQGNSGKFMSPFTSDGVTAEWVTKAMKVQASGSLGQAAGSIAATQLLSKVPFAGMFAGDAGKALARKAALNSIGGEEFLKSSTDQSFSDLKSMAAYMYAFHSQHPEYKNIVKATIAIYPGFAEAHATYKI
jgi:hypothetical protein